MALIWHAIIYGMQALAKFVALAVLSMVSLAVSILINSIALTCTQLLMPIPGFRIVPSGFSPMELLARILELCGT